MLLTAMNMACEEIYIFDEQSKYVFQQGLASEGTYTALFVQKKIQPKIKEIQMVKVEAGEKGFAKNKGTVALRFKVNDSTLAFVNTHLQKGNGNIPQRNAQLKMLLDEAFKNVKGVSRAFDHNFLFVLGDLNFRVVRDIK